MSQLAQVAQTLNNLAFKKQTTPDDVIKEATARGDPLEKVVAQLGAHWRRALADAAECATVVTAAQRLMDVTEARAAAFNASLTDVVEAQCHVVEAEFGALTQAKDDKYDALISAKHAELDALSREKFAQLAELQGLVAACRQGGGPCGRVDAFRLTTDLVQWANKTSATIIYDSTVDEFTHDGLFDTVKGKKDIALVGFTTDGDVFGGFYSVAVTEQGKALIDPNMFAFSFESHGRCMAPQRFVVKEKVNRVVVKFYKNGHNGFVGFWVDENFGFRLGNERSDSNCVNMSLAFEGLENTTLTGKNGTWYEGPFHHCTRLVAVQLE